MSKNSWYNDSPFEARDEDNELWLAAIDKLIDGASFDEKLVSTTRDGIKIQPLYEQANDAPLYARAPDSWLIPRAYKIESVKSTNKDIIADLATGTNAVELLLNHDNCQTLAQLHSLLNNVHTEMLQLSLAPSAHNADLAMIVFAHADKTDPASLQFAINADPLGTMAHSGIDCENHLKNAAIIAAYCAESYPNTTALCVDTSMYHNAGCSEAQELALLLATCTEYLRAMEDIDVSIALSQLRYRIALDSDYFLSVAKLRAARALLTQLAQHCGVSQFAPVIDTVSSLRTMTAMDETVNILRTTTQATAAMTGGANSYYCDPYNMLSNSESTRAARLCQNTHHVLIEEAHLLQVQDPMRGSGFIESVTDSLCEQAWQQFQETEQHNGLCASLRSGAITALVKDAAAKRKDELENNETSMVGVNIYPNSEDNVPQVQEPALPDPSALEIDFKKTPPAEIIKSLLKGKPITEHAQQQHLVPTFDPIKPARDAVPFEGRLQ